MNIYFKQSKSLFVLIQRQIQQVQEQKTTSTHAYIYSVFCIIINKDNKENHSYKTLGNGRLRKYIELFL